MAHRYENGNWNISEKPDTWEEVAVCVLMDIRRELIQQNAKLQRLVNVLECQNCLAIPRKLDRIIRNTTKRRRVRKK